MRYCPLSSVDGMVTFAGLPSTDQGTCKRMTNDMNVFKADVLMFCWYQVTLPGSRPVSSILNHSALVESYWSHVVFPHDDMYVIIGPMLCGHCAGRSDPLFFPDKT